MKRLKQERVWIALVVVAALLAVMVTVGMAQDAASTEEPLIVQDATYTVEIGDTLDTIAQQYNVALVSLMEVNGLQPGDLIFPGDTLTIPAGEPPYGFYPGLALGNPDGIDFYVVQPLDVLDLIAAYFDVDLRCFAEYNQITEVSRIYPGLVLAIPIDCPTYSGMSSMPLAPLRGAAVAGASARFLSRSGVVVITATPVSPDTSAQQALPSAAPAVATETPVLPTATVGPTQTTAISGGMQRGPTVTPTPSG
ncbi:MAG: LysM peptidoglycan-binding domain-containing protein [Anaerolineae bacterium]